ncbi:phage major capsid protein [Pseudoclavibacter terrae]|uniref:phage major capsid protein n=1 Tax=Pseudoclavibacter terrae TaxID=1530195 RepID=UPI00233100A8|nr:phage major capsid protein [Pseudoclavibacter terrae]
MADDLGTTITAFVTDASTALAIFKLRVEKDSNLPLLGMDATGPAARQVLGIPHRDQRVADGTVWTLDASRALVIMRSTIAVSNEAYFGSDSVAVRAIARVGFAFPSLRSLVEIQTGA